MGGGGQGPGAPGELLTEGVGVRRGRAAPASAGQDGRGPLAAHAVVRCAFLARLVLYGVLVAGGVVFMTGGMSWQGAGGSLMRLLNLPLHHLGHVVFSPLGEGMAVLGGSLLQVAAPAAVLAAVVAHRPAGFAGTVILWWTGQSLMGLSPYIADAPYQALPLLLDLGEEVHDWAYLLDAAGMTEHARSIARASFGTGSLLMALSFLWGGHVLYRQRTALA